MHDALHIANEFIRCASERASPLTNMQVQKLVYFAHARMLSLHGSPLIRQEFEAWPRGPVVPELYEALRQYGREPVREEIHLDAQADYTLREKDILDRIFNRYGRMSGPELSELTHAPGTPWHQANARGESSISNASIELHYAKEWRDEAHATLERIANNPEIRADVMDSFAQFERGEYVTVRTPEELKRVVGLRAGKRS